MEAVRIRPLTLEMLQQDQCENCAQLSFLCHPGAGFADNEDLDNPELES
jgi:hypothetical protein